MGLWYDTIVQNGGLYMPKSIHQKRKLLVLRDILERETDEQHPLTLQQILDRLAAQGITAERKSIYDDFEQLRLHGVDVIAVRDSTVRYYVGERTFDPAELRLLVDVVQSSRFITSRKSRALIDKLEALCSRHQAGLLRRQVLLPRIKTMNESIYYNVDRLQTAIAEDRQVTFHYFKWGVDKQRHLQRDGERYAVSPWALTWDEENYYLIAYDATAGAIRHYRVDRMLHIEQTADRREGEDSFGAVDTTQYTRKTFSMFSGDDCAVTLWCRGWMAGAIIDRFGIDTNMIPDGDGFRICVPVVVSEQFFAWLCGFGTDIRVCAPQDVADRYRQHVAAIAAQYEESDV